MSHVQELHTLPRCPVQALERSFQHNYLFYVLLASASHENLQQGLPFWNTSIPQPEGLDARLPPAAYKLTTGFVQPIGRGVAPCGAHLPSVQQGVPRP